MDSKRPTATILGVAALGLHLAAAAQTTTYADIAPILVERCAICHQGDGAPLGLKLDSLDGLLTGSRNGPVVKSGDPAGSELVRRIRGQALPRMPFDGPPYLGTDQIELIVTWIRQGARNADDVPAPLPVGAEVRLHGEFESGGRRDGLPLEVPTRARRDDSPAPGDYVEVRGRIGRDGTVTVERIRPR